MPTSRKVLLPRPASLTSTVAFEEGPDGQRVRVTVRDVILAKLLAGVPLADAVAAAGISRHVFREWRREGQRVLTAVLAGERARSDLSADERRLAAFAQDVETAESTAKADLLDLLQRIAQGGIETTDTTTVVTVDANGTPLRRQVEEKRSTTLPSAQAITWLLEHRWPADFARRTEITGAGGAPLHDPAPALNRLEELLAKVAGNREATTPDAIEAQLAAPPALGPPPETNGNGSSNGNGHHPDE